MKKTLRFLVILLVLVPTLLQASHFMGGEITWQCLPNGNFRFVMRVYRECAGCNSCYQNHEQLSVTNCLTVSAIQLDLYPNSILGKTDISPVCNLNYDPNNDLYMHIHCFPAPTNNSTGAIEEFFYTTDIAYPNGVTLNGIPPLQGWTFSFSGNARNPSTNINGANSMDWYLRAVMYPYNGQNENPCFDNSPVFAEKPVIAIGTSYPERYNPNAYDPEGDSLTFHWVQPCTALNQPITNYNANYSYTSPLPNQFINVDNVPATLDTTTGEIAFTSFTQGAFLTASDAKAYKNGVLVAEIIREVQIVLLVPGPNTPPDVTAPFPLNTLNSWVDTVTAGDLVTFQLFAQDTGMGNDGTSMQSVHFDASGALFGTGFTDAATGCLEPPCATLTPPPPATNLVFINTDFSWQTTCAHESFGTGNHDDYVDYVFVFSFRDDWCPVPGLSERTLKLVVKDPLVSPPLMTNMTINPGNGDVTFHWTPPSDPYNSFHKYIMYYKLSVNGPWQLLDSISTYNETSYTHVGAKGNLHALWYRMKTKCGCLNNKYSPPSDALLNPLAESLNIDDPQIDQDIRVSVDPNSDNIIATFNNKGAKQIKLQVTDALGRLIYNQTQDIVQGGNSNRFALQQPKPGTYFYKVWLDKRCYNGKFLIVK